MVVSQEDVNAAKQILMPDEVPSVTVRQRRIGPGGSMVNPTSVIATNKRIIIINRETLGIRKDYETIPYAQVTSVRFEKGIISSSVFIRVQGYDRVKGLLENGKEEGEINGLTSHDAKILADFINQKILEIQEGGTGIGDETRPSAGHKYCSRCGAKNDMDAEYCDRCGVKLE
ncbi:MAG: PH domain-containing protein [Candidatus Micrarchaeales archaeon]|jgi:hypothetical protein